VPSKSKSKSSIASFINKRQPKPSISEIIVTNVTLVQPQLHGSNQRYKASYKITVANCVGGRDLRIKVWTGKKAWLSDEPAMIMQQKVRSALHGRAKEHGLDMNKPICPTWVWKLLWTSFANEVNKAKMLAMKYSIASSNGHNARDDHIKTKTWERGSSFGNAQAQAFAKQSVLSVIEKRCEKQLRRVESVLSGIVSDLSKIGLDECEVLSHDTNKDVCTVMSMVTNANLAIKGLQQNAFNKRSASVLTGFCALMLPVGKNEEEDD